MKREEDLISILLKETYCHLSESIDESEGSLSDYFVRKQSTAFDLEGHKLEIYSEIVRVKILDQIWDIPFGTGIIDRSFFENSNKIKITPLADFILMNEFSRILEKKVSWLAYSSEEKKLYFVSREEAETLSLEQSVIKKAA